MCHFDKFNTLIGGNNTGKTAVLESLQKLFGTTQKEREVFKSDFHIARGESIENKTEEMLSIEVFIDFPEIDTAPSHIKAKAAYFKQIVISEEGKAPYFRIRLESLWQRSTNIEGYITTEYFYIHTPEAAEKEKKYFVKQNELRLIQLIYVPAQRDPSRQIKNAAGSIIWRLFRYLKWNEELITKIKDHIDELNEAIVENQGIGKIEDQINCDWGNYNDIQYFTTTKLSFSTTDLDEILKKVDISFQPAPDVSQFNIE